MPSIRGIEITLFSNADGNSFPEYPHPDGTSIRLALGTAAQPPRTPPKSPVNLSASPIPPTPRSPAHIPKADPKVSVYVPSRSGTQFSVQYNVSQVPVAPCKFIFFKLYMNGRLMTAWGCNTQEKLTGTVGRTFWAPAGQWCNDVGIEGRQFMFMPGLENKSAALDGGLIKVRAFRAKDRRLRAPKLETFRGQEQYGICAPSTGMLDKPEDVTYYQWHLIDPKDSPYVRFSFHYRTLESLKQLNLIPPDPRACSPVAAGRFCQTQEDSVTPRTSEDGEDGADYQSPRPETTHQAVCPLRPSTPEGGMVTEEVPPEKSPERKRTQKALLRTPPHLPPLFNMKDALPQPSKALRDASAASYMKRPLPELPAHARVLNSSLRSPSSADSLALSLSPSMEQSFEDRVFDNEEIEIGETKHVQLLKITEKPTTLEIDRIPQSYAADTSVSDYERSLRLTDRCTSSPVGSPNYEATTGAALQRGFELFSISEASDHTSSTSSTALFPPSHASPPPSPTRLPPAPPSDIDGSSPNKTYADTRTFAEWMDGTPSPIRRTDMSPVWTPDRWSYPHRRGGTGRTTFSGFQHPTILENGSEGEEVPSFNFDSTKENMPPVLTEYVDSEGNWTR